MEIPKILLKAAKKKLFIARNRIVLEMKVNWRKENQQTYDGSIIYI